MLDFWQYDFMRNAIYAGLLASVACGIVGVYVVVNRIVFISGGIAHSSLGGVGLGLLAGFSPIMGALMFSLGSALGIGVITRRTNIPEDTAIGVIWAVGMALGVIFVGLTPGYAPDLISYLFGNIITVPFSDLVLMAVLDAVILALVVAFYKEFLALSFDSEFATVSGVPVERLYLLLLCLIALTVVLLIRVVGIILVIALLTIPATMARQFTHDIRKMMLVSTFFSAVFCFAGLALSYEFDLASGATIILFSAATLIATLAFSRWRRRARRAGETAVVDAG
jgi:zinc transport system permease protein